MGFVTGALLASLINLPDIVRLNRLMAVASIMAAGLNLLLLEPGPAGAIACRFATGMALAAVYPPAMKLVSTWFVRNRGLALGAVVGALTLGSSMPHLFRTITEYIDWRLVISMSSAASLIAGISFLLFAREGPYAFGRAVFNPRQIGRVLHDRNLFLVNVGYLGHMWELYAMWAWLLIFLRKSTEDTLPNLYRHCSGSGWLRSRRFLVGQIRAHCYNGRLDIVSGLCALLIGFAFRDLSVDRSNSDCMGHRHCWGFSTHFCSGNRASRSGLCSDTAGGRPQG